MKPEHPVKMMRYRGADDAVVNFGHFAEVRKLQTGEGDPYLITLFYGNISYCSLFSLLFCTIYLPPVPVPSKVELYK